MLALRRGRVVDVDASSTALWGEELPAAPRNALHHHIARLRATLGEEAIVGSSDGYALKDARVDAIRFEELLAETRAALRDGDVPAAADAVAAALALWRGLGSAGADRNGLVRAPRRAGSRRCVSTRSRSSSRSALALGEHREVDAGASLGARGQPFP